MNRFLGIQIVWDHDVKSTLNLPSTSVRVGQVKIISNCKIATNSILISSLLIENTMH